MSKKILIPMAVALVILVFLIGFLVMPEPKDPNLSESQANRIHSLISEIALELGHTEYVTRSDRLQQSLTVLHVKCQNMSALTDFYYPADASFRHLADRIAQGAYSEDELERMHIDFVKLRDEFLSEDSTDDYIEERVMPYWELSKLLTDILEKWVRSDP